MKTYACAIAVLLALALAACSGAGSVNQPTNDPGEATDMEKAQAIVMTLLGDNPNTAPDIGKSYDCAIAIAHPQPLATPRGPVSGKCLWRVEKQDQYWIVTFREEWSCGDWFAVVDGYPPCSDINGSHEWKYQIDLTGPVQKLGETGQFAPDM